MPATLRIGAVNQQATAVMKETQAQLQAIIEQAAAANAEQRASAKATVEAQGQAAASYGQVVRAVKANIEAQAANTRATIDGIKLQLSAISELSTAWKTGSAERQALTRREIELQGQLAAATGIAAQAQARSSAAASTGLLGANKRFTGSAAATETGVARGALSKATGIGGFIAGPGFIAGAVTVLAAKQASDALRGIEEEMSQLEGAVKNAGLSWAHYRGEVEHTVKSMENLGVKESETLRGMTSLVRVTGDVHKSQRQMALAVDISRGAHISLEKAVSAVVQADNGRFRGIQRLIGPTKAITTHMDELKNAHIKVNDANREEVTQLQHNAAALDKQATSEKVLAIAQTKFAGEAERHMRTAEGATDRRRVAIEKLELAIGRGLLPIEHQFSDAITRVADGLRTSPAVIETVKNAAFTLGIAFKALMVIFDGIAWVLNTKVGKAFITVASVVDFPIASIVRHWQALWDWLQRSAVETALAVIEPFSHLPGRMGKWARDMKVSLNDELDKMNIAAAIRGKAIGETMGAKMIDAFTPYLGQLQASLAATDPTSSAPGGAPKGRIASAGAPPRPYAQRVFGPTPGLSALNTALPGSKGSPAIQFKGHAGKSYHYSGEALDIGDGGNPAQLISDWNFLYPLRNNFAELIWNPPLDVQARAPGSGAGYFWGVSGGFSDHTDHIHVAFTGSVKELKSLLGRGHSAPKDTTSNADATQTEKIADAKSKETPKKPPKTKKPGSQGMSLALDEGKLDNEQQDNARLIYKTAIARGLTPAQALEVVAAAYAESKLRTNALNSKSGAFGLFQLLSAGYKKAYEKYLDQGYDPATANTLAIIGSYVKFFKGHPHAAAGEAGAAVEASGEGPKFYQGGIGSLFKLTAGSSSGGKQASAAAKVAAQLKSQAKDLAKMIEDAVTDPAVQIKDIFSRIGTARGTLSSLGQPLTDANQAMVDQLNKLKAKLNAMLKSGLVNKTTIANIRAQIQSIGKALADGLEDQATTAQKSHDRLRNKITQVVERRQAEVMKEFDRATSAQIAAMRRSFDNQMKQFDKETQKTLQGFVVKQTPQEAALQQFQDQRQAEQDAASMAAAIASGDPEQIRQAQLDQQEKYLEKAADASRQAQDQMTQQQQDSYQEQRDQLRQALDDREQAIETAYQDQRDTIRQGMEDANADELEKLGDNLDQWDVWIAGKRDRLSEFWAWVKSSYGLGPGAVPWTGSDTQGRGGEEDIKQQMVGRGNIVPHFARGGTLRAPSAIGRGDLITAKMGNNETVIDSSLTDALREMVSGGRMGGGITVIVPGATLLGRDRDTARKIAETAAPELQRLVGYKTTI